MSASFPHAFMSRHVIHCRPFLSPAPPLLSRLLQVPAGVLAVLPVLPVPALPQGAPHEPPGPRFLLHADEDDQHGEDGPERVPDAHDHGEHRGHQLHADSQHVPHASYQPQQTTGQGQL